MNRILTYFLAPIFAFSLLLLTSSLTKAEEVYQRDPNTPPTSVDSALADLQAKYNQLYGYVNDLAKQVYALPNQFATANVNPAVANSQTGGGVVYVSVPGPAGPAGPQGPQGATGPAGPIGQSTISSNPTVPFATSAQSPVFGLNVPTPVVTPSYPIVPNEISLAATYNAADNQLKIKVNGRETSVTISGAAIGTVTSTLAYYAESSLAPTTPPVASGDYAIAIGSGVVAASTSASAVGYNNVVNERRSSAFGNNITVAGVGSTVVGTYSHVSGGYSSVFGAYSNATGSQSIAFGYDNNVLGNESYAVGSRNDVSANQASAFGFSNIASGVQSSAFGYRNIASGQLSFAVGASSTASGYYSSAFGNGNIASGQNSSAFGRNVIASADGSSAFGRNITNNITSSTMIGSSDSAKITILSSGNVGIGTTTAPARLTVDSGTANVAGVNLARLTSASPAGTGNGKVLSVDASGNIILVNATGTGGGVGTSSLAYYAESTVAPIMAPIASGNRAVAIGSNSIASRLNSSAFGYDNNASGTAASAFGTVNRASGDFSSAFGYASIVSGEGSSAFGSLNSVSGNYSYAFGYWNTVPSENSIAIGSGIANNIATSTMIGPSDPAKVTIRGNTGQVGFVGIGTTNPGNRLEIRATTTDASGLRFTNLTSASATTTSNGKVLSVNANGDVVLVDGTSGGGGGSSSLYYAESTTPPSTAPVASGQYAVAIGDNSIAASWQSSAVGASNTASTIHSSAFGFGNIATGSFSSAFGYQNKASNANAAFGIMNTAIANNSYAFGGYNTISGFGHNSLAFGYQNAASGFYSSAFGHTNTASATNSSAFGRANIASGELSSAFGFGNIASGELSSAFGSSIINDIANSTMIGPADAAKVTILGAVGSVGYVGIGTTTPTAKLTVAGGGVRFANLGNGTVQSDANGNLTVSSDENLKNIQGNYERGVEDILNINPISYTWKEETGYDTENTYTGFSAQNVQSAIPEAVATDTQGYLTLSDRPIIAAIVNAIKEIWAKIQELFESDAELFRRDAHQESEIEQLKERIRRLEEDRGVYYQPPEPETGGVEIIIDEPKDEEGDNNEGEVGGVTGGVEVKTETEKQPPVEESVVPDVSINESKPEDSIKPVKETPETHTVNSEDNSGAFTYNDFIQEPPAETQPETSESAPQTAPVEQAPEVAPLPAEAD